MWKVCHGRGAADSSRKAQLRQIVGEDTVDVIGFRASQRFLRLHDSHVVGDAGVEALPRQGGMRSEIANGWRPCTAGKIGLDNWSWSGLPPCTR
jgi:hypothetical protein